MAFRIHKILNNNAVVVLKEYGIRFPEEELAYIVLHIQRLRKR
ncbi:SacPA operon antiterminator [Geobacillus stearothermophilus]|uniref:SacPA operon antiterminator n=1 Tax=Geobacillus stearothermophilus TaxID=1422 RepID=A0A150N218_GEOSE|nr:PRD domain-containing protein [Geobacillus stearothermophilus]KAF6512614.1 SacPA operon antiterminator [Geobacillus stearothermophilus]KYD30739.1 hypothetical protein B4114_2928 [Geobacillus stearothermophilus]OAO77715.1 SacPA operon antiterminator [Geobacillus stearothermophilus]